MSTLYTILTIVYAVLVVIAIVGLLVDDRPPSKTVAWLFVLLFIPVVGLILWYFFGQNLRREWRIDLRQIDPEVERRVMASALRSSQLSEVDLSLRFTSLISFFSKDNKSLLHSIDRMMVYKDGYAFFPTLIRELSKATHHIHLMSFIFEDDPLGRMVSDVLIEKARQGVEVRVIYDDVGCWKVPNAFFERMKAAGVDVYPFLPVRFPKLTVKANYRNHRKICVVDGRVGFIGGMNIAQRYVRGNDGNGWRDTHLLLTGDIVHGMQRVFLSDWYFVSRTQLCSADYYPADTSTDVADADKYAVQMVSQIVTNSPTDESPDIEQGYMKVIFGARRYIYIETPYFIPPEEMLKALATAVKSGVDVRVITPMHCDSRYVEWASYSYLRQAIAAGVKVYMYEKSFLHSKVMVCDDEVVSCGSTNFDFRSMENNFESNAFIYGKDISVYFKVMVENDIRHCLPATDVDRLIDPPFLVRLRDSCIRLIAPLL